MRTGPDSEKKNRKGTLCLLVAVFLILIAFSMCIRTGRPELISPVQVFKNLYLWVRLTVADLFNEPLQLGKQQLIAQTPYYLETVSRFRNLLMTMICGAVIAAGGAVFQIVFQNPMATPHMLGTGSGISLGLLVLVLQYSANAYSMILRRYIYCLGFAFLMLILVILMGKFAGKNRTSVTDMLLGGALLSQMLGALMMYLRFQMDQDTLIILQDLTLYGFSMNNTYDNAFRGILILISISVICLFPLVLMRFSFDAMSFGNEESRSLGFHIPAIRIFCIISVTMMVTTATLYCGNIGVLSLAVPHISRHFTGNRFRDVLGGCLFFGAFLLLICRTITSFIYLDGMGFFPLATMTGLIMSPILALVLMQSRRGWE